MTFAKADGGVVNNAIERTERVDLGGDLLGGGDRGEISDDDSFGLGQGLFGVRRARVVARMQDNLMALIGKIPANHQTETIGRTGDKNARHVVLLTLRLATHTSPRRGRRAWRPDSAERFPRLLAAAAPAYSPWRI